jgi:hypothetical protein
LKNSARFLALRTQLKSNSQDEQPLTNALVLYESPKTTGMKNKPNQPYETPVAGPKDGDLGKHGHNSMSLVVPGSPPPINENPSEDAIFIDLSRLPTRPQPNQTQFNSLPRQNRTVGLPARQILLNIQEFLVFFYTQFQYAATYNPNLANLYKNRHQLQPRPLSEINYNHYQSQMSYFRALTMAGVPGTQGNNPADEFLFTQFLLGYKSYMLLYNPFESRKAVSYINTNPNSMVLLDDQKFLVSNSPLMKERLNNFNNFNNFSNQNSSTNSQDNIFLTNRLQFSPQVIPQIGFSGDNYNTHDDMDGGFALNGPGHATKRHMLYTPTLSPIQTSSVPLYQAGNIGYIAQSPDMAAMSIRNDNDPNGVTFFDNKNNDRFIGGIFQNNNNLNSNNGNNSNNNSKLLIEELPDTPLASYLQMPNLTTTMSEINLNRTPPSTTTTTTTTTTTAKDQNIEHSPNILIPFTNDHIFTTKTNNTDIDDNFGSGVVSSPFGQFGGFSSVLQPQSLLQSQSFLPLGQINTTFDYHNMNAMGNNNDGNSPIGFLHQNEELLLGGMNSNSNNLNNYGHFNSNFNFNFQPPIPNKSNINQFMGDEPIYTDNLFNDSNSNALNNHNNNNNNQNNAEILIGQSNSNQLNSHSNESNSNSLHPTYQSLFANQGLGNGQSSPQLSIVPMTTALSELSLHSQ